MEGLLVDDDGEEYIFGTREFNEVLKVEDITGAEYLFCVFLIDPVFLNLFFPFEFPRPNEKDLGAE